MPPIKENLKIFKKFKKFELAPFEFELAVKVPDHVKLESLLHAVKVVAKNYNQKCKGRSQSLEFYFARRIR